MAWPEGNSLAFCVGLAREMIYLLCVSAQLYSRSADAEGRHADSVTGVHRMRCFSWQESMVLMSMIVHDEMWMVMRASS